MSDALPMQPQGVWGSPGHGARAQCYILQYCGDWERQHVDSAHRLRPRYRMLEGAAWTHTYTHTHTLSLSLSLSFKIIEGRCARTCCHYTPCLHLLLLYPWTLASPCSTPDSFAQVRRSSTRRRVREGARGLMAKAQAISTLARDSGGEIAQKMYCVHSFVFVIFVCCLFYLHMHACL